MVVQHSYKSYFYYFTYSSTEGVDINVANVLYHNHAEPIEGVVVDLQIEQQVDYTEQNIHFAYNLTVTRQFFGSLTVNGRIHMLQNFISYSIGNIRYDLHQYQLSFATPRAVVIFSTHPVAIRAALGSLIRRLMLV